MQKETLTLKIKWTNKMQSITLTNHAIQRASQRGISPEQIELCISFGECINRTGREFYFVSKKCLKKLKKVTGVYMERLQGLTVMTGHGDNGELSVITVYKNNNAFKTIKRKKRRYESNENK